MQIFNIIITFSEAEKLFGDHYIVMRRAKYGLSPGLSYCLVSCAAGSNFLQYSYSLCRRMIDYARLSVIHINIFQRQWSAKSEKSVGEGIEHLTFCSRAKIDGIYLYVVTLYLLYIVGGENYVIHCPPCLP